MLAYIARNLKYARPKNWRMGARAIQRRIRKDGILSCADEIGMASLHPRLKVNRIIELVHPMSVVDIGCGTGQTTAHFISLGISAIGVEASKSAIAASPCSSLIRRHDLRLPLDLGQRFDLVWCFEVAEHIHPKFVDTFVDTLARHAPIVAMSAAPPGQGGEGHFNEQPKSYWISKFAERAFDLHDDWTAEMRAVSEFYSQNMMVYCTSSPKGR